ncbi:MAG: 1-deoxy-D-xylulose-5-phosphate reductoisomerase, partial [Rickettsiales bacterium]
MKTISIFGSTGVIGTKTIDIIKLHKENWKIHALVANKNIDLLIKQAQELNPEYVITADSSSYQYLRDKLVHSSIKIEAGDGAISNIAKHRCDIIVMAITGIAALKPMIAAIKAGSNIAIANKEAII